MAAQEQYTRLRKELNRAESLITEHLRMFFVTGHYTHRLRDLKMAGKTILEKAGEAIGFGMAMAEDVAGTVKAAVGGAVSTVTDGLKKAPEMKLPARKTASKAPAKKVAKKAVAKKAVKKVPAKKVVKKVMTKKAVKKTPAKKATKKAVKKTATKAAKKAVKKSGRRS